MKTAVSFVLLATAAFSNPVGLVVPASTVAHGAPQAISQAHSGAGRVQGELVVEQTEPNPLGLNPDELDLLHGNIRGLKPYGKNGGYGRNGGNGDKGGKRGKRGNVFDKSSSEVS
jgi:hypothetical protein